MKRAHIDHRLDSRATPAAAARGFALLRDRPALARLIDTLATTRVDLAGADRVAFALGAGDRAAHAIVDREGSGVTCLAPDMSVAAPVVAWPVVELFLRQQDERLQARRALQSVKDADDDVSPLVRLVQHPHRLVRREWEVLRALLPLLGVQLFSRSVLVAVDKVIQPAHQPGRAPNDAVARELWRLYVGGAVGLTLVGDQRGLTLMHLSAVLGGDLILAARALWYLANQPEDTLAFAASVARDGDDVLKEVPSATKLLVRLGLALALPAVGFRCPGFFKEAERLSARLNGGDVIAQEGRSRREVELHSVSFAPVLLRPFAMNPDALLDDPETQQRIAAAGDDVEAMAAAAGPWYADIFRIWRPFADARLPPRLVPRPSQSVTDDDDASATLWRSLLRHTLVSPILQPWLAKLVTLAPIEALVPGPEPDAEWRLSEGIDYVQHQLEWVLRPAALRTTTKLEPATAPKRPPPNGPCPCGSGKKFKKCHGKP